MCHTKLSSFGIEQSYLRFSWIAQFHEQEFSSCAVHQFQNQAVVAEAFAAWGRFINDPANATTVRMDLHSAEIEDVTEIFRHSHCSKIDRFEKPGPSTLCSLWGPRPKVVLRANLRDHVVEHQE